MIQESKCDPVILLFCCSPNESGWSEYERLPGDMQTQIILLQSSIVADIAERLSTQYNYRVEIHETNQYRINETVQFPPMIQKRMQEQLGLRDRVLRAVTEVYEANDNAATVVFVGKNPLYRFECVSKGIQLLDMEDDVVVFGEAQQQAQAGAVIWYATKSFHPHLYDHLSAEKTSDGTSAINTKALLVPLRSGRNIAGMQDVAYLSHEIEREVLLEHWYPRRTYEFLTRTRMQQFIPET